MAAGIEDYKSSLLNMYQPTYSSPSAQFTSTYSAPNGQSYYSPADYALQQKQMQSAQSRAFQPSPQNMVGAPQPPKTANLPQIQTPTSLTGGTAGSSTFQSPYKNFADYWYQTKGNPVVMGGFGNSAQAAQEYQNYLKTEQAKLDAKNSASQMPQQGAFPFSLVPGGGGSIGYASAPTMGYASGGAAPSMGAMQTNMNYGGQIPLGGMTPGIQTGGITQNPYSLASQNASNMAGQVAGGQANANLSQADLLRGASTQGAAASNAILNTAFDPQNALYNRTAQQLQDQVRVGEAARGLTKSPYGAGLENQAMSNFNIDWQNQQLGRQLQGIQGYSGATGTGREAATGAANLGQMGVGQVQAQGQMPWDTWNQQQQTDINNWIAYMNMQNAAVGQQLQNYPNQVSYYREQNPYISQGNQFTLGY